MGIEPARFMARYGSGQKPHSCFANAFSYGLETASAKRVYAAHEPASPKAPGRQPKQSKNIIESHIEIKILHT